MRRTTGSRSAFPAWSATDGVLTAPHLVLSDGPDSKIDPKSVKAWINFDLASALAKAFGKPTRVVNDADLQGLDAATGKGLEVVITLGTGFGTAVLNQGQLVPHMEFHSTRCATARTTTSSSVTSPEEGRQEEAGTSGCARRSPCSMPSSCSTICTSAAVTRNAAGLARRTGHRHRLQCRTARRSSPVGAGRTHRSAHKEASHRPRHTTDTPSGTRCADGHVEHP